MEKSNFFNGVLGSRLLTCLLLHKNLRNHCEIVDATMHGISISKYISPYQCLKALLQIHPSMMDMLAIMQERSLTYKQMWEEIKILSDYIHFELTGQKGERVSVCAAGSIEGIVLFFALNRLGLVNARVFNGSKEEKMKYNINNFSSRIVAVDERNLSTLSRVVEGTNVEVVIALSKNNENMENEFKELHPDIRIVSYSEIIKSGRLQKDFDEEVLGEDLASILYTSGSSGEPKPIAIPNKIYTNMVEMVCKTTNMKKYDGERVMGVVSHEYPYAAINCTVMVLLMGKTLIMPKRKMDGVIDFDELMEAKPNKIQAIPNFYKLLEQTKRCGLMKTDDFGFLNWVISGGEKYLNNEKRELLDFLARYKSRPLLVDGFGFGELGSAAALKFGMHEYFLLMNGIEAKSIHPETKDELSLDEEGILCFTAPTIADGYYNNAKATRESFVRDMNGRRWFVSDTYGAVHGKKRRLIKLSGRIREYFITSDGAGNFVKVYAGTVEDVIMSCPHVKDCIVVPSDSGATPGSVAYVSICGDEETGRVIDEIKEKCQSLEKFSQPVKYEIEPIIVRTHAGKKDYGYYKKKVISNLKMK